MKTLLKTIGIVSTLIGSSFLFQNCSEKESIPEGMNLGFDREIFNFYL